MNMLPAMLRRALAQAPGGSIPFDQFMESALYHPGQGYYERREHTPGRQGDFFTSVSVGPLFGELLAHQFARWLALFPPQSPVCLVEAGAHDGRLAADLLATLHRCHPTLAQRLTYIICEPSPTRARWQQETLVSFGRQVRQVADWSGVPCPLPGVIFSNEMLDALPVRRYGWDAAARHWFEWQVGWQENRFAFVRRPAPAQSVLPQPPPEILDFLPDGFTTEVATAALEWWRRAATGLASGSRLLTLDYGLDQSGLFSPQRGGGTVRAFRHHQLQEDVLASPGEQDLTAHVHFHELQAAGEACGLTTESLQPQSRFLTQIAAGLKEDIEWTPPRRRQFQTLVHPEYLGSRFQVLVQFRP